MYLNAKDANGLDITDLRFLYLILLFWCAPL